MNQFLFASLLRRLLGADWIAVFEHRNGKKAAFYGFKSCKNGLRNGRTNSLVKFADYRKFAECGDDKYFCWFRDDSTAPFVQRVIEGQNRGVRWQTEVVCQKRIRGLLRATKRFFSNKHQDRSDEFQPLENFILLRFGRVCRLRMHADQAHLF